MKKIIILLLIIPFLGFSQVSWKRYNNDSIIQLDDDFKPIGFDTSVCPANYKASRIVSDECSYNFGQDSICLVFLGTTSGKWITFRYIFTASGDDINLRIEDGEYVSPKQEAAEYNYLYFGGSIALLILVLILYNRKKNKHGKD